MKLIYWKWNLKVTWVYIILSISHLQVSSAHADVNDEGGEGRQTQRDSKNQSDPHNQKNHTQTWADNITNRTQTWVDNLTNLTQIWVDNITNQTQIWVDNITNQTLTMIDRKRNQTLTLTDNKINQTLTWVDNKTNQTLTWTYNKINKTLTWLDNKRNQTITWVEKVVREKFFAVLTAFANLTSKSQVGSNETQSSENQGNTSSNDNLMLTYLGASTPFLIIIFAALAFRCLTTRNPCTTGGNRGTTGGNRTTTGTVDNPDDGGGRSTDTTTPRNSQGTKRQEHPMYPMVPAYSARYPPYPTAPTYSHYPSYPELPPYYTPAFGIPPNHS